MHCATRTQISRISCYTKLLIVVKGFSKDLVSIRTARVIRSKNKCHPFECPRLSVRKNHHPFERLALSVREKLSSFRTPRAVRSKKSSSVRTARAIRSKQLSAALLCQTTSFTRAVCDQPVKKCELIINNSSKPLFAFTSWIFTVNFLLSSLLCFHNIGLSLQVLFKTKV